MLYVGENTKNVYGILDRCAGICARVSDNNINDKECIAATESNS